MLAEAGIHTFFNGPESFTPDDAYHLGLAPEMDNVWVAAGFNSIGIQSAGGAGMALAEWMDTAKSRSILAMWTSAGCSRSRATSSTCSNVRKKRWACFMPTTSPIAKRPPRAACAAHPFHHHLLKEQGAVMGEIAGWERANWFANEGQEREYQYSWKRQNWFENSAAEHRAVRENVGMYDMSSFGKIRVEGPDAEAFMNYMSAAATIRCPMARSSTPSS